MPALYRLTFLPEGRTEDFCGSRGNYYRLGDGSRVTLSSIPVWCHGCGRVTHGEDLGTVEAVEARMAEVERIAAAVRREMTRPPLPAPDAPGDRHQQEQLAELRLRREWRKRRQSPPRCVHCGTTRIVPLKFRKPVGVGRGSVVMDVIGQCSTQFNEWYFTAEGERIVQDAGSMT